MKKKGFSITRLADVPIALCQLEAEAKKIGGESGEIVRTIASTMFDYIYAKDNIDLLIDAEKVRQEIGGWLKNQELAN